VSWEHERVEELLAGYVLGGLDAEDAALAERALLEHVPGCERCRRALDGFRLVAGDLALAAPAAAPPDTLLPRLRRSLAPPRRRRVWPAWALGSAAAVILIGLSGWSVALVAGLSGRLDESQRIQGWLVDALSTATHPSSQVLALEGTDEARVSVLFVPESEQSYLMATNLPDPRFAYHIWFQGGGKTWHAGVLDVFHGWGMMPVETNPDQWEVVLLTDEPRGRPAPEASPLLSATVSDA
jgi:anti-sigma factor RsiW